MPEPMRPASLRSHHARIVSLVLSSNFLSGQLRPIVLRKGVSLQSRAVRRRVEFGWLLEDNGLAISRGISDTNILRSSRNTYASPECSLQRQQKPRDNSFGGHRDSLLCSYLMSLALYRWLMLVFQSLGASISAERKFHKPADMAFNA